MIPIKFKNKRKMYQNVRQKINKHTIIYINFVCKKICITNKYIYILINVKICFSRVFIILRLSFHYNKKIEFLNMRNIFIFKTFYYKQIEKYNRIKNIFMILTDRWL